MTKQTFTQKSNGDTLSASEWNQLTSYVNTAVDAINAGGGNITVEGGVIDTSGMISVSAKGNTEISSAKNINLEAAYGNGVQGDIALKPGDDIQFFSHHREPQKRDKVVVKNIDNDDNPVKLDVVAGEINLAVGTKSNPKTATRKKDKTTGADIADKPLFKADDAKTLDLAILTGAVLDEGGDDERDERGYLKVRAQAIDLRCEKHGGIALQPKGYDSTGNMNKIKFEHGGGDGLEFGTFNTEKSSLYTDEYRFKKDGVWKMATRTTEDSGKTIRDEGTIPAGKTATGALKYVKQADDFYDIINPDDETASTNAIIKTAHALNDGKNRHAKYEEKVTTSGNLKKTLEIETVVTIQYEPTSVTTETVYNSDFNLPTEISNPDKIYTISDFKDAIKTLVVNSVAQKYGVAGEDGITLSAGDIVKIGANYYKIVENFSPSIDITSGADLSIKAKEGTLSLGGNAVEFGSDVIELGEMEDGLYAQYKLTKKNNSKPCDTLKIKVINNQTSPLSFDPDSGAFAIESFYPTSAVTIPAKVAEPATDAEATQHIQVVAQCKLYDVIKFVAWAKNNNFGPWAN